MERTRPGSTILYDQIDGCARSIARQKRRGAAGGPGYSYLGRRRMWLTDRRAGISNPNHAAIRIFGI
jgi:hypothetical protein